MTEYYKDLVKQNHEVERRLYEEAKAEILAAYERLGDWDQVLPETVYIDSPEHFTAFIDLVEELYGEPVKDGRDLQRLTGITVKDPAEDGWQSWDSLDYTVHLAREQKYIRALETIIIDGGKYADMVKLEPSQYGLPTEWKGFLEKEKATKDTCIMWAIILATDINEPGRRWVSGSNFRDLATLLEAPYSVILAAHERANKWRL